MCYHSPSSIKVVTWLLVCWLQSEQLCGLRINRGFVWFRREIHADDEYSKAHRLWRHPLCVAALWLLPLRRLHLLRTQRHGTVILHGALWPITPTTQDTHSTFWDVKLWFQSGAPPTPTKIKKLHPTACVSLSPLFLPLQLCSYIMLVLVL